MSMFILKVLLSGRAFFHSKKSKTLQKPPKPKTLQNFTTANYIRVRKASF